MQLYRATIEPVPAKLQDYFYPPKGDFEAVQIGYDVPGARFWKGSSDWMHETTASYLGRHLNTMGIAHEWETAPWPYSIDDDFEATDESVCELPYFRPDALRELKDEHGCLRPWQKAGPTGAVRMGRFYVQHPPGTGKTLQGIIGMLAAVRAAGRRRSLPGRLSALGCESIVMPRQPLLLVLTTASAKWQITADIRHFTKLSPFLYKPVSQRRKKDLTLAEWVDGLQGEPAIVVIGRENLPDVLFTPRTADGFISQLVRYGLKQPLLTVIDELHEYRSHKLWQFDSGSGRCIAADNQVAAAAVLLNGVNAMGGRNGAFDGLEAAGWHGYSPWRFGLSATPTGGRIGEFWGQHELLDPGMWGKYRGFATRYAGGGPSGYNGAFVACGATNTKELNHRMAPFRHHTTAAETDPFMPAFDILAPRIPVDQQAKTIPAFKKDMKAIVKEGKTAESEEKMAALLTQIASARKRPWLVDTCIDEVAQGRKVLLFTGFRSEVEAIAGEVERRAKVPVYRASGEDDSAERSKTVVEFNNATGACVLVGTGASIGTSLNIQNTDVVIFGQTPFTVILLEQWMGRARRLGRKREGRRLRYLFPLAEGTYDTSRLRDILALKASNVSTVMDATTVRAVAEVMDSSKSDRDRAMQAYIDAIFAGGTELYFEDDDDDSDD